LINEFVIFELVKKNLVYILFFLSAAVAAQDKVYFLDGSSKTGKVIEITSDEIKLEQDEIQSISKSSILLIQFKNGSIEVLNRPGNDVIYNSKTFQNPATNKINESLSLNNILSINTLALCNSDISGFYERILSNRVFGFGLMGAYNFNGSASLQNAFILSLANAKKNYDLGFFANVYSSELSEGTVAHFGLLFKYMDFSFSKAIEENVYSGGTVSTNIKYTPAKGNQLATIFTFGSSTKIGELYFLKTIFGIGGFNLRGDYKQQYNYYRMKNPVNPNSTSSNLGFLLKLYIGINFGYNF